MSYCSYCDKQVINYSAEVDLVEPKIGKCVSTYCTECGNEISNYEK